MREILMKISIIVKQRLRGYEFFSRIGLEKFAILIHGNEFEASTVLERLKDGFEGCGIMTRHSSGDLKFTIKIISWKSNMTLIDWLEAAAL
jgi:GGDEF domain-containing protein